MTKAAHVFADPQISLIISVYNHREFARAALRSALRQNIDIPYEILICDDGSSEIFLEDLTELSNSVNIEVRYIWQSKHGFRLSRSRNNAIDCSRGSILVFADGDTILAPHFLADHWLGHATSNRVVCGKRQTTTIDDPSSFDYDSLGFFNNDSASTSLQEMWYASESPWMACLGGNFSAPSSAEVRFDEQFVGWGSEDRDLAYRLFRKGLTPILLTKPNAIHLRSPGEGWENMQHNSVVSLLRNKLILREKYPNGEMHGALEVVRNCHFDAYTGGWHMGPQRHDTEPDEILSFFYAWDRSLEK